jgi:hypothetical protein
MLAARSARLPPLALLQVAAFLAALALGSVLALGSALEPGSALRGAATVGSALEPGSALRGAATVGDGDPGTASAMVKASALVGFPVQVGDVRTRCTRKNLSDVGVGRWVYPEMYVETSALQPVDTSQPSWWRWLPSAPSERGMAEVAWEPLACAVDYGSFKWTGPSIKQCADRLGFKRIVIVGDSTSFYFASDLEMLLKSESPVFNPVPFDLADKSSRHETVRETAAGVRVQYLKALRPEDMQVSLGGLVKDIASEENSLFLFSIGLWSTRDFIFMAEFFTGWVQPFDDIARMIRESQVKFPGSTFIYRTATNNPCAAEILTGGGGVGKRNMGIDSLGMLNHAAATAMAKHKVPVFHDQVMALGRQWGTDIPGQNNRGGGLDHLHMNPTLNLAIARVLFSVLCAA